jgi:hypothetical protein
MLVRFRDPNDPMTVEGVNKFNIARDFGAGAQLVRATLEIVPAGIWPFNRLGISGQPITTGIEKRLPWLTGMKTNIDGRSITDSNRLSNVLNSGDFKRV